MISSEERRAMQSLRMRLEKNPIKEGNAARYAEENMTDQSLWRYCVAQKLDVDAAETMFRDSMRWRSDVRMDAILASFDAADKRSTSNSSTKDRGTRNIDEDEALAALGRRVFYAWQVGTTIDGAPLLFERIGHADLAGLASNEHAMNASIRAYSCYLERAWRFLAARGRKSTNPFERGMIIVDLQGMSMSTLWNISALKRIIHAGPLFYPEITKRVLIIRVPSFFTALWGLVKPFVPERTLDKIKILGHDFASELDKITLGGIDALPRCLGGKLDVTNDPKARPGMRVQDCQREIDAARTVESASKDCDDE